VSLRIAFIGQKGFPATWGGVEAHVHAIATRLARRGHDVSVYVRPWYSPSPEREIEGVRRIRLPTIHTKHLDAAVHSALCAAHAATRGFDVVHFHAMGPALFSAIPRLSSAAVVTTLHGRDDLQQKWGAVARLALRTGEGMAFRNSDRVVVVSRALQQELAAQGRRVEYVPNGVDVADEVPCRELRDRFGLEDGAFVLAMGRWIPDKRMRELVEAFVAHPPGDLRLVVAGDADDPRERRAIQAAARGSTRVVFPGMVGGRLKAELLTHARAFVTASAHEGMPITLLEAMAAGRLCLASDIEPHREILGAVDERLLFPVADPGAGLERIASIEPGAVESRLQELARGYSWDQTVTRLEALYREVVR